MKKKTICPECKAAVANEDEAMAAHLVKTHAGYSGTDFQPKTISIKRPRKTIQRDADEEIQERCEKMKADGKTKEEINAELLREIRAYERGNRTKQDVVRELGDALIKHQDLADKAELNDGSVLGAELRAARMMVESLERELGNFVMAEVSR